MASIRKRTGKKGVSYFVEVRKGGFEVRDTFTRKADAEAWARDIETQIDKGIYGVEEAPPPPRPWQETTLAEALQRYLEEVTSKKGESSVGQEENRIEKWLGTHLDKTLVKATPEMRAVRQGMKALTEKRLVDIDTADLLDIKESMEHAGAAASTIRNDLNLISKVFKRCALNWRMKGLVNPLQGVSRLPEEGMPEGRTRRLMPGEDGEPSEYERIYNRLPTDPPVRQAFVVSIETAVRQGELLDLRWEWIGKDWICRIPPKAKTKRKIERQIPISMAVRRVLEDLPKLDGKRAGKIFHMLNASIIRNHWEASHWTVDDKGEKVKDIPDLRWHDLRHESTSRLFEKGLQIHEVRLITGHKTLEMLMRYTQLDVRNVAHLVDPVGFKPVAAAHLRVHVPPPTLPSDDIDDECDDEVEIDEIEALVAEVDD